MFAKLMQRYSKGNLILQICVGIVLGIFVGLLSKDVAVVANFLGILFTSALKAIAPMLVFILILTSICTKDFTQKSAKMKNIAFLYIVGTFLASACAVGISFLMPTELVLEGVEKASQSSPAFMSEIFKDLILKIVDNPINALSSGNYLGILAWAIAGGVALRHCSKEAKQVFVDINEGVLKIVQFIVKLAPFGIFGLVANSVASTGAAGLISYAKLLLVLVGTMLFVAFVINALIVFIYTRKNPFPLIFICLRESAFFAFFTRSSAANIPVNMALCAKLGIDKELYSISIPLGATINMGGAAVTIAVLSLAAAYTVGIEVSFFQAFLLSIIATFAACGASGVAGGSLLLIPLACSLFNINYDVAMKIVAIGFIIGVIQDSVETALNSSTDVLFTAICSKDDLRL
ncbi:serine/threonine transporter SstT [Campylobacter upsaliensis]|uniref:DAACS family serine/threonine:sodium (Na+) symporter SstT n=3 Tax=Campylobacter upsaliensis TaxID=28080 RepID=A0A828QWE9_CAMUP|nr:serine/threonine transporter SstT [Campylobacter upsaliensis]EAB5280927.1 serine/threonine transporter SstT [Campylobacter upsaliensis]EAH4719838.1 serine/threonine transporter SstT [Campylobacter upsaliensis]EAH5200209.1 serine/threonine transporter SstT [Campylobacter upsaliensis]EAH5546145.1 serine/threonine transporter SstT [Campylobacter upsaliensis]EAH5552586.1 serine/threonine transporter SstT [Campylobacter upsaliensis]